MIERFQNRPVLSLIYYSLLAFLFYFVVELFGHMLIYIPFKMNVVTPSSFLFFVFPLIKFLIILAVFFISIKYMRKGEETDQVLYGSGTNWKEPIVAGIIVGVAAVIILFLISSVQTPDYYGPVKLSFWKTVINYLLSTLYRASIALLFFGVMEEFILQKTNVKARLFRWDIDGAVFAIALIEIFPLFLSLVRMMFLYTRQYPILSLLEPLISMLATGTVTFIAAYWYSRTRNLAASVIAYTLTREIISIGWLLIRRYFI